ncbi:ABC transporter permease protein [Bacillus sp. TS-2]|nr:ABC transporter permease protein [Bacillus sp. TS-2]
MKNLLSIISICFLIVSSTFLISLINDQIIYPYLAFGITGGLGFLLLILYSAIGLLCAIFSKKNSLKILLIIFGVLLLLLSVIITLIGAFAFQNP